MKIITASIYIAAVVAAGAVATGCSTRGEQAEVKEEATQIEAAHLDGREAARAFVNRHFKDSLELQQALVEAGARRAHYDSLPRSLAAYDSAFISTIRTVRPEIADQLQRRRTRTAD